MGCSAGSVGSYLMSPYINHHYKSARQYHMADSFVLLFGVTSYNDGVKFWDQQIPDWIPAPWPLPKYPWDEYVGVDEFDLVTNYYPKCKFSSYTSNGDQVQQTFYQLGGAGAGAWPEQMRDVLGAIHGNSSNYATFIARGNAHCQTGGNGFYTTEANNVKLVEFLASLLKGGDLPPDVDCKTDTRGCK